MAVLGSVSTGSSAAALRPDTAMRRVVDAVTAFVALVIVSPLLVAAAVAVKATSRGPALYKQVRAGKSGQMFTMLKFRSMVCDDEQTGPLVTERADPRITRLGPCCGRPRSTSCRSSSTS